MATYSSTLAWKVPWMEEPGGLQSVGSQKVRHDWGDLAAAAAAAAAAADSILKSRDITLPTKVCLVKAMIFPEVMYGCESWTVKKAEHQILMLLNCGVGEDSWESLGLQGDPTSPFWRRSALGVHWKDWCWSWNSNTLATSCEELTLWKGPWCCERLGAGGEGDDRGWDGWMASPTQCTWVWVNSGSWWWKGRPGLLWFMGLQRVGQDWVTELNSKFLYLKTFHFRCNLEKNLNTMLYSWN